MFNSGASITNKTMSVRNEATRQESLQSRLERILGSGGFQTDQENNLVFVDLARW